MKTFLKTLIFTLGLQAFAFLICYFTNIPFGFLVSLYVFALIYLELNRYD